MSSIILRRPLSEDQAAEYLGIEKRTLQKWRYQNKGPRYISPKHQMIRYWLEDLEKWLEDDSFVSRELI